MLLFPQVTDNRIINGDFIIDQPNEFAAVTPAASAYVNDLWKFETSGLGSDFTFQIVPLVGPLAYLNNQLNNQKILVASSATPSAGQFSALTYSIEGSNIADFMLGTNNALNFTVSFQAYCTVSGAYTVSIRNSATNRTYLTYFTLSSANRWTIVNLLIPGDISGTWLNTAGTVGMRIGFDLGSGSTYQGNANAWNAGNFYTVAGATELVTNAAAALYITRIKVRPGPLIDDSSYFPRPYSTELALCQRFYEKTFPAGTAPAQNAGVTGAITVKNPIALGDPSELWQFKVTKAKTPAITAYNPLATNANWRDITAASDVTVSIDPGATVGPNSVHIATSGTVTTLGDILAIHAVADSRL